MKTTTWFRIQQTLAAGLMAGGLDGFLRHPTDPWFIHALMFGVFVAGLNWYVLVMIEQKKGS